MNTKGSLGFCVYLLCVVLWIGISAGSASAHKAVIFAWVEGDTVFTARPIKTASFPSRFLKGQRSRLS